MTGSIRPQLRPSVVVLAHEAVVGVLVEVADALGQLLEVGLARGARREVEQHLGRAVLVAEAVDPAGRDVGEVAGVALHPVRAVEDRDRALEDVERLGDRPVEVGAGPARRPGELPPVEPERPCVSVPWAR